MRLELKAEEIVELSVPEHLGELGMMHAEMSYHVRLLVILHRAVRALETRWLLALIPQVRQHRFLPFVRIVTTRALVHLVPSDDHELPPGTTVKPLHPRHTFTAL